MQSAMLEIWVGLAGGILIGAPVGRVGLGFDDGAGIGHPVGDAAVAIAPAGLAIIALTC